MRQRAAGRFFCVSPAAAGIRNGERTRCRFVPAMLWSSRPEVRHWHGASADSWFAHLAVEIPGESTSNEWCEPVSEADYRKLGS